MNTNESTSSNLGQVDGLVYLTPDNSRFEDRGGFIAYEGTIPVQDESFELSVKSVKHERVFLHRLFPYEQPCEFISVTDTEGNEIGIISKLTDFDEATRAVLFAELSRKYYIIKIKKILSVKDRYGFSYWRTVTDAGEMNITLQDPYRNITRVSEERLFITDVDGNRYEIESTKTLDAKSMKKIEVYI